MTAAPELTEAERATVERFGIFEPEERVERVARAIMDADYMQATGGLMDWSDDLDEAERDDFRSLARAAIAALEPTS